MTVKWRKAGYAIILLLAALVLAVLPGAQAAWTDPEAIQDSVAEAAYDSVDREALEDETETSSVAEAAYKCTVEVVYPTTDSKNGGLIDGNADDAIEIYNSAGEKAKIVNTEKAPPFGKKTTFNVDPGEYTFKVYYIKDDVRTVGGEGTFEVLDVASKQTFYLGYFNIKVKNDPTTGKAPGFHIVLRNSQGEIQNPGKVTKAADVQGDIVHDYIVLACDASNPYYWEATPIDDAYSPKDDNFFWTQLNATVLMLNKTATVSITNSRETIFHVTKGADVRVFRKGTAHFFPFTEYPSTYIGTTDDEKYDVYKFKLPSGPLLHYEAGGGGWLKQYQVFTVDPEGTDLTITLDLERLDNSRRVDNGYLEDDLYMNLDDSKYVVLKKGESFDLFPLRVWQGTADIIANYFVEPDYHVDVTGVSVSEPERTGKPGRELLKITGEQTGVSIVKITYDALLWYKQVGKISGNYSPEERGIYYNAIDPINTGIVIVNVVDDPDAGNEAKLKTNINQREYDTIYFDKDKATSAPYTFKPTADRGTISVRVHDPLHNTEWGAGWTSYEANGDGSFTVHLKEGRSIIEVSAGDAVQYHVVNAKGLKIKLVNKSNPDWKPGDPFKLGETAGISFEGLKLPVQKIAGIYNPGWGGLVYVRYETPDGRLCLGPPTQYDIAGVNTVNVLMSEPGEFTLGKGRINCGHLGSALNAHRKISPSGVMPNLNASEGENTPLFSTLPDLTFEVLDNEFAAEQAKSEYAALKEISYGYYGSDNAPLEGINSSQRNITGIKIVGNTNSLGGYIYSQNEDVRAKGRYWFQSDPENVTERDISLGTGHGSQTLIGPVTGEDVGYGELTLTPTYPEKGYPLTYTFRLVLDEGIGKYPYITDIKINPVNGARDMNFRHGKLLAVAEEDLGLGFLATRSTFTTTVPYGVDKITVSAQPLTEGDVTTAVTVNGEALGSSGTSQEILLQEGANTIEVAGTVPGNETPVRYTLTVTREKAPNRVVFEGAEGGKLVIKTAGGKTMTANGDGSYSLPVAQGYIYYYSKTGYLTATGTFDIGEDTVNIVLPALTAHHQADGEVTVSALSLNGVLRENQEIEYKVDEAADLAFEGYVEYNNGGYTVLHALIDAFNYGNPKIPFQCERGNLVPDITIKGDTADGAGWVCEVNGEALSGDKLASTLVKDGDNIVYYYNANFAGMQNAWFEETYVTVAQGENAVLTLLGAKVKNDGGDAAGISNAKILVNSQDSGLKTGADGRVTLPASLIGSPGQYTVTAVKEDKDGHNTLIHNRAVVRVTKKSESGIPTMTVKFRLIGDTKHEDGCDGHTKYVTWIKTKSYTFDGDKVSVYDVFTEALDEAGLKYIGANKNYVSGIYAPAGYGGYLLREFDNGPNSGWMYTVNGDHPIVGLKYCYVTDGDSIVWHYVDDYKLETSFEGSHAIYPNRWLEAPDTNPPSTPAPTGSGSSDTTASSTSLAPKVTATNGVAMVGIKAADMTAAIADAKEKGSAAIVITPEITGKADKVSVELPKSSVSSVASETSAALTVQTPVGNMTLPKAALASVAGQAAGSSITFSLETVDTAAALTAEQKAVVGGDPVYHISIMSGGKSIGSFGGTEITISLPYTLKEGESAAGVTVWYLNDTGELEKMTCTYNQKTGMATFTTNHLSYFVVGHVEAAAFADVKQSDWFHGAVIFAVENGLFKGTSDTTFSPHDPMTRAMLVTALHRLADTPEGSSTEFTDVERGAWYADAVAWAAANDIVSGYGRGLFGTNDNITREQMAAILYRYAGKDAHDISADGNLAQFTDREKISSYAADAMKWAVGAGLIDGKGNGILDPAGSATRAEVAAILQRFVESFVK